MTIMCYCGKIFKDGLKLAKHRLHCRKFQVAHYHRTVGPSVKIPGTRNHPDEILQIETRDHLGSVIKSKFKRGGNHGEENVSD